MFAVTVPHDWVTMCLAITLMLHVVVTDRSITGCHKIHSNGHSCMLLGINANSMAKNLFLSQDIPPSSLTDKQRQQEAASIRSRRARMSQEPLEPCCHECNGLHLGTPSVQVCVMDLGTAWFSACAS